jgi:hypothetical protein
MTVGVAAPPVCRYGRELPLNAYLLDMVKHGDMKALVKWNGIRAGDVFDLLRGMEGLLQAVAEAVALAGESEVNNALAKQCGWRGRWF